MIDGNLLAILMIVIWLGIIWLLSVAKSAENQKHEKEATERMKEELKGYGFKDIELNNLGYHGTLDMLNKHKEKVASQKMQEQRERNNKLEERRKREEEYEKKEEERINKEYQKRPTVFERAEDEDSMVSIEDMDYLSIRLFGNGGEFKFIYIDKQDYELWNAYINEGEVPDGVDEDVLDNEIHESDTITHYAAIYSAEVGTKNHFMQFEFEDYTEDDSKSFGDLIKDHLFLKGDEDGYIVAEYTHSKKHYVEGTIGLDMIISGPLTKDQINFHDFHFNVGTREFDYSEFWMGEYTDWWNTIYRTMFPVSKLKDISPSDIW